MIVVGVSTLEHRREEDRPGGIGDVERHGLRRADRGDRAVVAQVGQRGKKRRDRNDGQQPAGAGGEQAHREAPAVQQGQQHDAVDQCRGGLADLQGIFVLHVGVLHTFGEDDRLDAPAEGAHHRADDAEPEIGDVQLR